MRNVCQRLDIFTLEDAPKSRKCVVGEIAFTHTSLSYFQPFETLPSLHYMCDKWSKQASYLLFCAIMMHSEVKFNNFPQSFYDLRNERSFLSKEKVMRKIRNCWGSGSHEFITEPRFNQGLFTKHCRDTSKSYYSLTFF